jgi:hypothetical protein
MEDYGLDKYLAFALIYHKTHDTEIIQSLPKKKIATLGINRGR